jgi:hypothetical protein
MVIDGWSSRNPGRIALSTRPTDELPTQRTVPVIDSSATNAGYGVRSTSRGSGVVGGVAGGVAGGVVGGTASCARATRPESAIIAAGAAIATSAARRESPSLPFIGGFLQRRSSAPRTCG